MTAAWPWPCWNSRAAANRRASSAALRRAPRCGVVMPQHRMVLDEIHHFISRDSLENEPSIESWSAPADCPGALRAPFCGETKTVRARRAVETNPDQRRDGSEWSMKVMLQREERACSGETLFD